MPKADQRNYKLFPSEISLSLYSIMGFSCLSNFVNIERLLHNFLIVVNGYFNPQVSILRPIYKYKVWADLQTLHSDWPCQGWSCWPQSIAGERPAALSAGRWAAAAAVSGRGCCTTAAPSAHAAAAPDSPAAQPAHNARMHAHYGALLL